ncbi:SEN1 N terminal-domain-containing protein [Geopyxis carbonaria]|nr:SEN1 N terminal-domain-containing protein [Geopyxis carbonaria]
MDEDPLQPVQEGLRILANLPEEVHWLCDKIEKNADGRTASCEYDEASRANSTMHAMMILSFSDQESTQEWLKNGLETQLTRCPRCVEEFYSLKRRFYAKLLPDHGQENLDMFFNYLTDWDIQRVTPVLSQIVQDLNTATSLDAWFSKLNRSVRLSNAIYECLCSPDILKSATVKADLKRICSTKRLKIQGPAAALIYFLFAGDEDEELRSMAEISWQTQGPTITRDIFEIHLLQSLESETRKIESESNPTKLARFFRGVSIIADNVSRDIILRCISGAEKDPIGLAARRVQPNIPYWPALLRLFGVLMRKLQRDVWAAIVPCDPQQFSDMIFRDRSFANLLRSTQQSSQGESQLLDLTEWMSAYIHSLEPLLRPNAASSVVEKGLDSDLPALSRGLCLKEVMKILSITLAGAETVADTGNTLVRDANNLYKKHMKLVLDVANSAPSFGEPLMEKHMVLARHSAQEANIFALRLGLKFMQIDHLKLSAKVKAKPIYNIQIPTEIWASVAQSFPSDNIEYCNETLEALRLTFDIDLVYVRDGEDPVLRQETEVFNTRLREIQRPLADILRGLTRCSTDTLGSIMEVETSLNAIFTSFMSRFNEVAEAGEDVLITSQKAEDNVDALRLLVVKDIATPLLALTSVARVLHKVGLFARAPRWVKTSILMIDILCDRTQGVIRTAGLETWGKTILKNYWIEQWRTLGSVFKKCRRWSMGEEKLAMTEFLRDTMDYAENFFDQFWTFEQALRGSIEKEISSDSWSDDLLLAAAKALTPFTTILSIQDEHLLQTCQKLMCKMLTLLDQKLRGKNREDVAGGDFFKYLKKFLYPESSKNIPTNLTEIQKTELAVLSSKICVDFIPAPKEVIELSDDENYIEIPDDDLLKAELVPRKPRATQSKLEFPPASRSSAATTQKTISKSVAAPLRIGVSQPKKDDAKREAFLAKRREEKAALERKRAAVKKSESGPVQIQDSDSDSDSSEEEEGTLFKLGGRGKTVVKDAVLPAAVKKPLIRRPVVVKRAKDNRARIAPDMSPLYKQIFKWDFFHNEEFPPGLSARDYSHVKRSFDTFGQYKATFEPLLLLEAWQSFLKCKEEATPSSALEVKISTRMRADNFVELETTVEKMDDRYRWMESDVVLLSTSPTPLKPEEGNLHCIARIFTVNRKFRGPREVSLRCDPGPLMLSRMTNGGILWGVKLMSLTPLEREYGSLICLQYYDLRTEILNATPRKLVEADESRVAKTQELYNVNEPQAKAIISATSGSGFTLIQGPPGTGKTKTVIGIVGALLTPGAAPVQPQSKSPSVKKILVCAPSNAAVDELVIRFKQGVRTIKGDTFTPTIVRIGRSDAINAEVKDVTLEDLIDARMGPAHNPSNGINLEELRNQRVTLTEKRNAKQVELDDCRTKKQDPGGLLGEVDSLNAQIRTLGRQIGAQMDQRKESSRNSDIARRHAQQEIMNEAQIICATLSGSGHEMLRNVNVDFETVIIDEAAQSVELSALIPLKFGCEKCILVGDPQQLPPTVLSRAAAKFSYEKSLFVRMQENYPQNVHLLSIQYRMHPSISSFPSKEFYNSGLLDGPDMASLRKQPWHESTVFGPYRFFNVAGREVRGGTSLVNHEEVNVAMDLFARLTKDFHEVNFDGRVGIVTPYRQQLTLLKRQFESRYGEGILKGVEFNTVDAFQGRERDIIIFSCVRAADEGGVGFLSDIRRMNVGLTRAKASLFVLGNSQFLVRNVMWRRLIEDAKARHFFTEGNIRSIFQRSTRTGSRITAPPLPKPVPAAGKKEVDLHWDPMDIDYEESATNGAQTPAVPERPQYSGPSNTVPHIKNKPPGPNIPPRPQAVPHPPRPNPTSNPNIKCHNCGEMGHRKNMCTKRPAYIEAHDPQIPVLRDTESLKRPRDIGNESSLPNKRIQNMDHSATASGSGSGTANPNQLPQALPRQPKKGVVRRKGNSNPFITNRKPQGKPPSGPPSGSSHAR